MIASLDLSRGPGDEGAEHVTPPKDSGSLDAAHLSDLSCAPCSTAYALACGGHRELREGGDLADRQAILVVHSQETGIVLG